MKRKVFVFFQQKIWDLTPQDLQKERELPLLKRRNGDLGSFI